MARRRRFLIAGGIYHVINRGNNRATLFRSATEYGQFMALVQQAQERLLLPLLAFALMPNHLHMVVTPNHRDDVGKWMQWLLTTHASRHHRGHETSGHVWQGRFKAFPVERGDHLLTVLRYVERNPVRAGLVRRSIDWPWCSAAWRNASDAGNLLDHGAVPLPADWSAMLDRPEAGHELEQLRTCVNSQLPYGSDDWIAGHAGSEPRRRPGRPCKSGPDSLKQDLTGV